jgi:hypothetical protein
VTLTFIELQGSALMESEFVTKLYGSVDRRNSKVVYGCFMLCFML